MNAQPIYDCGTLDVSALAAALREARAAAKITQEHAAAIFGVARSTYASIETRGQRNRLFVDSVLMARIACYWDLDLCDFGARIKVAAPPRPERTAPVPYARVVRPWRCVVCDSSRHTASLTMPMHCVRCAQEGATHEDHDSP